MARRPGSRLSLLFELHAASRQAGELLETAMVGAPLTPEDYAVYSVLFDEGPQAPTELARRVGMPPTSMSRFIRAMNERGHVQRSPVASDRRSYRIMLSSQGEAAHAAASAAFSEADRRFLAALSVDEDAARSTLRSIGRAASAATARLAADSVDQTA